MKRGWMAISATTTEALMGCISDGCLLISVEQPLLDSIRDRLEDLPEIQHYELIRHDDLEIVILKKVRDTSRFDDERFYIYHHFLNEKHIHQT